MEQQMWFFGCDAACADGNLLMRYGFRRYRRETHRGESSCYRFLWRPTNGGMMPAAHVDLHGWCAGLHPVSDGCREGGFLYVRARSRLGWYDAPEPPAPGDYDDDPVARRAFCSLGRQPEPAFRRAAARFLTWVGQYESWVEAACGPGYRRRCFERAPLPWLPPTEGRLAGRLPTRPRRRPSFPMNTEHLDPGDSENEEGPPGVRTLSQAKRWLANLARNGAADVHIKEPPHELGGGLLLVTASLVREDGARVNVAVYCYDDTPPAIVDWLPPIPRSDGSDWLQGGKNFG